MQQTEHNRLCEAYVAMWKQARYRPAAPTDWGGSIALSDDELADSEQLAREAAQYAQDFIREENGNRFWIGTSDWPVNRAMVYTIEAARLLCGGLEPCGDYAIQLLEMALKETRQAMREQRTPAR